MVYLRSRTIAAAAVAGVFAICGMTIGPAVAYPPGRALAIACDAFTYGPGGPATCTLSNLNPDGPDDIVLGNQVFAAGNSLTITQAAFVAQDAGTYVEVLTLPQEPGIYEVIGTSADEVATTTVQVVVEGTPTEFGVTINDDGSVTVSNGVPGCTVTVFVDGKSVGTFVVGADGTVTVPADVVNLVPGSKVTAEQGATDSCVALTAEEVVVGQPAAKPSAPKTGANVALGFVAGLTAIGIGGGLYAAGRRKKV